MDGLGIFEQRFFEQRRQAPLRKREAGALGSVMRCQLTSASLNHRDDHRASGQQGCGRLPCASSSMPSVLVT